MQMQCPAVRRSTAWALPCPRCVSPGETSRRPDQREVAGGWQVAEREDWRDSWTARRGCFVSRELRNRRRTAACMVPALGRGP
jgi:hypothetical protein